LGWAVIAGMTGSWAGECSISSPFALHLCVFLLLITDWLVVYFPAAVFLVIGLFQMVIWADKKHKAYKKDFGKAYPAERKALIPFIL
jgi:hypothetical protein